MAVKGNSEQGAMSRRKGVTFERYVAKVFTEWWGSEVRRTPLSGAYGGEWNLAGDLMFQEPFPYLVELKNRENWTMEQVFEGRGPVFDWWTKASKEAAAAGLEPMLVFSRARKNVYVMCKRMPLVRPLLLIGGAEGLPVTLLSAWLAGTSTRDVRDLATALNLKPRRATSQEINFR